MSDCTSTVTSSSLYLTIADQLRKGIRSGVYQPGQLIGSEHALAREQHISRMTVRRASGLLVDEGLLERRPGKGLFVRANHVTTRLIQAIAGNLAWDTCLQVSRGLQAAARDVGIQVQLYDAHGDADLDLEVVRQLPDGPARGAVVVSLHGESFNEVVFELKTKGFPFVLVDQRLQDIEVPSVTADNHSGGYQAGKVFAEAGHRRVGFVGDLVASTVRDRLNGLRDGLNDAGIAYDRSLVSDLGKNNDRLGDWSARVEECVRDLMSRPNPPSALFCSCDAVARSAYRAIGAMGLSVPNNISVIGFDDDPLAEWLTPRLTTLRQPFRKMGQESLDLLMKLMSDPHAAVEHRVLPVELIRGQSVAPVGRARASQPVFVQAAVSSPAPAMIQS